MRIKLEKASIKQAEEIHRLQVESFLPLLQKYKDSETNPGNEKLERILHRFKQPFTTYYFITLNEIRIGAIRIVYSAQAKRARISPIFVTPEHQGKGYGQEAMSLVEKIVDAETWELDTIMQENGNCYLYEKMGYKKTGVTKRINDIMTIVSYEKKTPQIEIQAG